MSLQSDAEKKEQSLSELVIIVVIIAVLMASFISYFFKQEQNITHAGFTALANRFMSQVQAIHASWLMDNKPDEVKVKDQTGNIDWVKVNKQGWIDRENCQLIWQAVMDAPLELLKQPIAAIDIIDNDKPSLNRCRFALNEKIYFEYFQKTGKVKL